MKKDIKPPKVEGIAIAAVQDENELGTKEWNIYFLNLKEVLLEKVIITSKGYGENKATGEQVKTSVLRHLFDEVASNSFIKVEPITEDVLGLSNEYWVSYFYNNQIYDKKYVFLAESISEENLINIPLIKKKGVMLK